MEGVLAQLDAALATKGLKRGDRTTLVVLRREEQRLASAILSLQKQIEGMGDKATAIELLKKRREKVEARMSELTVCHSTNELWLISMVLIFVFAVDFTSERAGCTARFAETITGSTSQLNRTIGLVPRARTTFPFN